MARVLGDGGQELERIRRGIGDLMISAYPLSIVLLVEVLVITDGILVKPLVDNADLRPTSVVLRLVFGSKLRGCSHRDHHEHNSELEE